MQALVLNRITMTFRTLFFLLLTTLVGCDRDVSSSDSPGEINSLNIFLSIFEDAEGNRDALSFARPSNDQITQVPTPTRATFFGNEDLFFEMETNRRFQGYEFLAYIAEDTINPALDALFLLDYSNDSSQRIRRLSVFNSRVCSISPILEHDQQVFEEGNIAFSPLLHRPIVAVSLADQDRNCNGPQTSVEVSFNLSNLGAPAIITQIGSPVQSTPLVLFRARSGTDEDGNELIDGTTFYLESSLGTLRLIDREEDTTLWTVQIPDGSEFVLAEQISNDTVFIQTNERVYVRSLNSLLTAQNLPNENNQTLQQTVFGEVFYELIEGSLASSSETSTDERNIAFSDGDNLVFFDASDMTFEAIASLPVGVNDFDFILISAEEVILKQAFDDRQELIQYTRNDLGWRASQGLVDGLSADLVDIGIQEGSLDFYVNTFNLGQNNNNLFWQAHFFTGSVESRQRTTFNNSSFLLTRRVDNINSDIFLLNTTDSAPNGSMMQPSLFGFDVERARGIAVTIQNQNTETVSDDIGTQDLIGTFEATIGYPPIFATAINDEFVRYLAASNSGIDPVSAEINSQFYIDPRVVRRDNAAVDGIFTIEMQSE